MDWHRRAFLCGDYLIRERGALAGRRLRALGPAPPRLAGVVASGACTGCGGPCAGACDRGLIQFHSDRHYPAATPYLDFAETGCTFCGRCDAACPASDDHDSAATALGYAQLDTARCLAWRQVLCLSCMGRCPLQAIQWDPRKRPSVDLARCSGCGACVGVCPEGAIAVQPTNRTMNA